MGLVPVEVLDAPSINQMEIDWVLETEPEKESWMTPSKDYLLWGVSLDLRNERRQVLRKASWYIIQKGVKYKKDFFIPLLRCIANDEVK